MYYFIAFSTYYREGEVPMSIAPTHLYFIGADGVDFVKVGRSKNPEARLHQLRTGSPYKLRLLRIYQEAGALEPYVLATLRASRAGEGEWFLSRDLDFDQLVADAEVAFAQKPCADEDIDPAPQTGLGPAIAQARKALGLKQQDLQHMTGISQKYLSKIENERADPGWKTVIRIARALQLNLQAFVHKDTCDASS
jgi:DNA-binding XRE family transcriptional regulator